MVVAGIPLVIKTDTLKTDLIYTENRIAELRQEKEESIEQLRVLGRQGEIHKTALVGIKLELDNLVEWRKKLLHVRD